MRHLRAATKGILKRVEDLSGKSIQFVSDEKLPLLATLQIARNGADFHVLRYKPSAESLDYLIAFQAGFVLRLYENEPDQRFDFSPAPDAGRRAESLILDGLALSADERKALPAFADSVAQWALMNLRSLPIGMRIDRWIADDFAELRAQQQACIAVQVQQNVDLLSFRQGKLSIPTGLLAGIASYALFAERLLGDGSFSVPYGAAGALTRGEQLLSLLDGVPSGPQYDCELVDRWAAAAGLAGWYNWIPYVP
jgi:hypothetical protein